MCRQCYFVCLLVLSVNHKGLHPGWKQTSIYLLALLHNNHKSQNSLKIRKINLDTNILNKTCICTNIKHQFSKKWSIRCHPWLGHAAIVDPFVFDLSILFKKRKKKGNGQKWQTPMPYGSMLHITPTDYHLLAAKQEPSQSLSLNEKH